jgi:hypothetical protein
MPIHIYLNKEQMDELRTLASPSATNNEVTDRLNLWFRKVTLTENLLGEPVLNIPTTNYALVLKPGLAGYAVKEVRSRIRRARPKKEVSVVYHDSSCQVILESWF